MGGWDGGVGSKGTRRRASEQKKLSAREVVRARQRRTNRRGRLLRDPPRHGPAPACVGAEHRREMPSKSTPVSFQGWPSELTTPVRSYSCDLLSALARGRRVSFHYYLFFFFFFGGKEALAGLQKKLTQAVNLRQAQLTRVTSTTKARHMHG